MIINLNTTMYNMTSISILNTKNKHLINQDFSLQFPFPLINFRILNTKNKTPYKSRFKIFLNMLDESVVSLHLTACSLEATRIYESICPHLLLFQRVCVKRCVSPYRRRSSHLNYFLFHRLLDIKIHIASC